MVSPINYSMNVLNPIEGYLQGLKFGEDILGQRQGRELAQSQEVRAQETFAMAREDRARAIRQQQAEAARDQAQRDQAARGQQALLEYLDKQEAGTATASDLRRAMAEFPQVSERFQSVANSFTEERLGNETRYFQQLSFALGRGNTDAARGLIQERLDASTASGDDAGAAAYQSQLQMLEASPETLLTEVLMPLVSTMPVDDFDKFYELAVGGGEADGPLQVRSSQILDDGTVVVVTDGGPIVYSPSGDVVTGQAAADAVLKANEYGVGLQTARSGGRETGTLTARAGLGAEASGAVEAGKTGIEIGRQTFERIGPLRANIANLDRAIELVEEEGANTGVIASRLPNWNSSTIELDNLQNQLGLDVIGSVTFGALSQGELDLALNTALPTNLSEPELVDWLERKRDAQDKLADYLTDQARFLSTPGRTLDQWINFTESGEKDVRQWMRDNPIGRRTERVAPSEPTAPTVATSDNSQFVQEMEAKLNNGERLTQAEMDRLNVIGRGGQ
jgi:hypothetical protein